MTTTRSQLRRHGVAWHGMGWCVVRATLRGERSGNAEMRRDEMIYYVMC